MNNSTLLYLDLSGNNITEEIIESIDKIMQDNLRRNPMPRDRIFGASSTLQSGL